MNINFITGNKNKFTEAQMIIPTLKQLDIDLPEIQEIDAKKIIEAKLKEAIKHQTGDFIVEDTSLYISCLPGLPGPLIKWFMETIGNQGIFELCQKYNNYSVEAKTIVGYAKNKDNIKFFEGKIKGAIVKPVIKNHFGWDAIFKAEGQKKTFAEMSGKEKNLLSMRRLAFKKLKNHLKLT